jgi:WD40 repeat protein
LRTFSGDSQQIDSVAVSADRKLVLSVRTADGLRLWASDSGHLVRTFSDARTGEIARVAAATFSPDETHVLSAGANGIKLWDVATGNLERTFDPRSYESAVLSPRGDLLYAVTSGGLLRKWEIRTGKQLWEVKTGSARESLAISPNGSRLSSRGFNSVALWNAATGEPIHQLPAGGSSAVAFSANNKYLVTMDGEHVMILEAEGGQLLRTIDAIALCAAISPDSSRIVTAAARVLDIWDSNTGALQFEYGNEVNTQLISFTSDEMGVLIRMRTILHSSN